LTWLNGKRSAKNPSGFLAYPYPGKSYSVASGSAPCGVGSRTSPDCDAEAVPQSGGTVPRGYAAKA